MSRVLTIKNAYDKKHVCFKFDGIFLDVFGEPEKTGLWLIYGKDKNGKTWGTLLLAEYLSRKDKVLYISAEQGISKSFVDAMHRAKLDPDNKNLHFIGYISLEELISRLSKKNAPSIVVLDNLTFYTHELKKSVLEKLIKDFPKTVFIMVAHEERGNPYTAIAMYCKKLAEIVINIQGLAMNVSARCPGGTLLIDEEKAALFHGQY